MSVFRQLMMRRYHSVANYMDLTVVGSPTISNNVVSNFSTVDYVNSNVPFNPVNGVWEVGIKLTTGDTSQEAAFFRSAISAPANAGRYGISLTIQNAQFKAAFSFDGNSWVVPPKIITYIVQSNTTYFVKCGWTGSVYYLDFSLDGVTYTRVISYDSSNGIYDGLTITQFGIFSYDNKYALPWLGSIDFNSSYIKLNGVKYQFRFTMPLTVVGTPTITDGVVSGFTTSDYIRINPFNNIGTQDFELATAFITNTSISMRIIATYGAGGTYTGLAITNLGAIRFTVYNGVNQYTVTSSQTYQIGIKYYIKCYRKGTEVGIKVSTDNVNWITDTTVIPENTNLVSGSEFLDFGVNRYGGSALNGSIDLNNTYIKINNKLWFNGQQA